MAGRLVGPLAEADPLPGVPNADEEAFVAQMANKLLWAAGLFAAIALLSRLLTASVGVMLYLVLGGLLLAGCAAGMQRARR